MAPDSAQLPYAKAAPITLAAAHAVRAARVADSATLIDRLTRELLVAAPAADSVTESLARVVILNPKSLRPDAGDRHVIYIHGGAYILGAPADATGVLLADALGLPVHSIDYSLSPEAVFPQAIGECVDAYLAIVERFGPEVVVVGVSAGGSLALSLVQRLQATGAPLPHALALVTPWSDLAPIGDTYESNEGRDPIIRWNGQLDGAAAAYAGVAPYDDPLVSPIYADYDASFPPSIITCGTSDLFLSNCVRLYWKLRRSGARTELLVWEGMWHAFLSDPEMDEAKECRTEIAEFLWRQLEADSEYVVESSSAGRG